MIDLENIETLARAATPGPWVFAPMTEKEDPEIAAANGSRVATLGAADITKANSAYIAAANPAAVLELIEKLRVALAAAPMQAQEPIADASADIFDLIREWAHLPEGQRGDAARNIIGCLNRSYSAGVSDGEELGRLSAPAAQGDAKELTDKEIVQAVRSVGVDTHPSKFGLKEQIEGMSVTVLRQVIAAIAAKAVKS